ncbi:MAG: FAD-dependent pyridine nucleotide-disulfide oxidoreductase [Solirubrobacterales bacterium]|jgi:cation diffusion facilitator CzcD-associated flavoprotein CzcO|nr:FAD-dependent pyridine nucleotide-disulfide oxidoreductase [Solirubrobacterales bacterium]
MLPADDTVPHVHIVIAGTGFGGLGTAIRLIQAGERDFVVLEKAADVGGTWRENTYPGVACDVPSHLYSFSFAPNPDWTHTFSGGAEIWEYLRKTAREHGVLDHVRYGHEVLGLQWDDDERRWHVETSAGSYTADLVVSATGGLHEPSIPALAGLDTFAGETFHSARWNHDHDLEGRSVAVIGTGASSIQFIPRIQPKVGRLTLFQRTPPWIMPRSDRPLKAWEHRLYRALPAAQKAMRAGIYWGRELFVLPFMHQRLARFPQDIAEKHLARAVEDPQLRSKLTPRYKIGCKRILISNDYLPALTQENVDVVTSPIAEVRPHCVITQDGVEHAVDTIIFATGFHVTDIPIAQRVRGRTGELLADEWKGSPRAHLGTMTHGYPNLFFLLGPNTGLGHNSVVFMIEAQIALIMSALRHLRRTGAQALEPRVEAQDAFVAQVDESMRGTVWTTGGCQSWYLDATGRNSTLWPGFTYPFKRRLEKLRPAEYLFTPPAHKVPVSAFTGSGGDLQAPLRLASDDR